MGILGIIIVIFLFSGLFRRRYYGYGSFFGPGMFFRRRPPMGPGPRGPMGGPMGHGPMGGPGGHGPMGGPGGRR